MIYEISNKLRKNGLCFTLFFAMILFMLLTPSFEYITTIHAGAAASLTGTKVNVKSPTANLKKGLTIVIKAFVYLLIPRVQSFIIRRIIQSQLQNLKNILKKLK